MKLKMRFFCVAAVLVIGNICLYGQGVNYVGTSSANFLKIGIGAKNVGTGESEITDASDASILYWNPGAISRIEKVSLSFSYLDWLVGSDLANVSCTVPLGFVTAGVDITYFTSGDIEETTLADQDGTGRFFSATDMALGLTFAKNITDRFSVGLKVKYLSESLSSVSSSAFAFDIGSVFTTSFLNNMELGITLSNFGSAMQLSGNDLVTNQSVAGSPTNKVIPASLQTETWDLPLFFRIGASTKAIDTENYSLKVSAAVLDSRDYATRFNVGGELGFFNVLKLRSGYKFNNDVSDFSAGFGLNVQTGFTGEMSLDYAFTQFKELNSVHQVSVSFNL
jgi:hypothetical protein